MTYVTVLENKYILRESTFKLDALFDFPCLQVQVFLFGNNIYPTRDIYEKSITSLSLKQFSCQKKIQYVLSKIIKKAL